MNKHIMRTYAVIGAMLVFFLAWAVIAAHPWATPAKDPRVTALQVRERHIHQESIHVNRIVRARWSRYRTALERRQAEIAAVTRRHRAQVTRAAAARSFAPSVTFVHLAPVTVTRTS